MPYPPAVTARRVLVRAPYDLAVGIAMLIVGIVEIEPAPVDVLFAALILVALLTGRLGLRSAPPVVLGLAAAFIALNLLAFVFAQDLGTAVGYFAVTAYLLVLGVWTSGYVDRATHARTIVVGYIVGAVVWAAVGTLAVLVSFPGSTRMTDSYGLRANALFKDANVFGPFLVVAAVLVVVELLEPALLQWHASIKLAALVVLVIGIVYSFSRGAWVNLAVAAAVIVASYVFGGRRDGRALVVVGIAVGVLSLVAILVVATGTASFLGERAGPKSYDSDRFGAQRFGVELAQDHPLGIGPGQFEAVSPVSAHSIYVRALAEEGVAGFVVLVALLGATLLLALQNLRAGPSGLGLSPRALLAIWCGLLVNSLVIDTLHWRHLWIVAGLIWASALSRSHGVAARFAARSEITES
jgi:O-antigen ligase